MECAEEVVLDGTSGAPPKGPHRLHCAGPGARRWSCMTRPFGSGDRANGQAEPTPRPKDVTRAWSCKGDRGGRYADGTQLGGGVDTAL